MHTRHLAAVAVAAAALLAACTSGGDADHTPPRAAGGLTVTAERQTSLAAIGADSLSDSARVVALYPEEDGESIVFTFADPGHHITSGLGLVGRGHEAAELIWPDSVSRVWWPGPHRLSFTSASGEGVHAVVDVHAAKLEHIEESHPRTWTPPPDPTPATRARATAWLDSARVQPQGVPQGAAVRYLVTRVVAAPGDSLAAFHVVGRGADSTGRVNPAWYILDLPSGRVAPVDSLVGQTGDLPERAGAWASRTRFVYGKGRELWSAEVRRAP